jgi:hypothetical protein
MDRWIANKELLMAETRTNLSEQDRVQSTDQNTVNRYDPTPTTTPVGVYDRPATTARSSGGVIGTILMVLLLLIVAYFIFQWLF